MRSAAGAFPAYPIIFALAGLSGACAKTTVPAASAVSYPSTISFASYDWKVKASTEQAGPGPNYFSAANVTVDSAGKLHLKIAQENGHWACAEIVSARSFGYGTYVFYLSAVSDSMNEHAVLGLFTWSDDPAYHDREIDFELSRWSDPAAALNAQFVVQPAKSSNEDRFAAGLGSSKDITVRFTWSATGVAFQSYTGFSASLGSSNTLIRDWNYTGADLPVPGGENARINLWLNQGSAPSDGKPVEVVIQNFQFLP